jgi:hypothetical protein
VLYFSCLTRLVRLLVILCLCWPTLHVPTRSQTTFIPVLQPCVAHTCLDSGIALTVLPFSPTQSCWTSDALCLAHDMVPESNELGSNQRLMLCIRRASLDAFWSRGERSKWGKIGEKESATSEYAKRWVCLQTTLTRRDDRSEWKMEWEWRVEC